MVNWKLQGALFLFAAFLSLLSGLFSAQPLSLGILLSRMLVSGALFCGLGFAAIWVLRRFLPELFTAQAPAKKEGVDVVIPEENPWAPGSGPVAATAPSAPQANGAVKEPAPEEVETLEGAEVVETVFPADSATAAAAGEAEGWSSEPAGGAGTAAPEPAPEAVESLDSIPDFEPSAGAIKGRGPAKEDDFTRAQVDSLGSEQDPEVLAKAIRTIIRKDQEG